MSWSSVNGLSVGFGAALALGLAVLPTSSQAVSITNRDDRAHSLRIIEGSQPRDHRLAPGGRIYDVCKSGCIIRIDGSAEKDFVLEGTERVSIESDLMYYDGEVAARDRATKPD